MRTNSADFLQSAYRNEVLVCWNPLCWNSQEPESPEFTAKNETISRIRQFIKAEPEERTDQIAQDLLQKLHKNLPEFYPNYARFTPLRPVDQLLKVILNFFRN